MSYPWFRAYAEMLYDEKLLLLDPADRWYFVAILCLKCSGRLDNDDSSALRGRKVAVKLGLTLEGLEAISERLAEVGLIERHTFQPIAWDKRQFKNDSSAARTRRWRERKATAGDRHSGVTVTPPDTDTDHTHAHAHPRAREVDPDAPQPTQSELATQAMVEAGMPASYVNPLASKLLDALALGVTPDELFHTTRELASRGTGPPKMNFVIATVLGRRRDAALVTSVQ